MSTFAPGEIDVKDMEFDDNDDDDHLMYKFAEELEKKGPQTANITVATITPAESLSLCRQQQLIDEEVERGVNALTTRVEKFEGDRQKVWELTAEIENKRHEIHKLKGEATLLRRENENLKKENVEHFNTTMNQQKSREKKRDDELNKLKLENSELKAVVMKKSITTALKPVLATQKHINVSAKSTNWIQTPLLQPTPQVYKHAQTKSVKIQTDKELPSTSKANNRVQFDVSYDEWSSTTARKRGKMFSELDKILELNYEIVFPILQKVCEAAEKTIFRSMFEGKVVRNVKSVFPDILDTMFQWGVDKERKKNLKEAGIEDPNPPILPSTFPKDHHRYSDMKIKIEASYKDSGVWGALTEVRNLLEKVLQSLQNENRFRLYELNTLTCFWKLLCWGNELWKCLLSEEEEEEEEKEEKGNVFLIEKTKGKGEWNKELERWSGLILKSDWRDFISRDLEVEVRKVCLETLESIVLAGYFERSSRRYDILYRVLSDVLTKRVFQESHSLIQRVIKILHWSLSDLLIFKYLCRGNDNDNPCLAKLLGDCILDYIRDKEKDPIGSCMVFLDYIFFLEALSLEKIPQRFESKHANEVRNLENQRKKCMDNVTTASDKHLKVDIKEMASQFACPMKYECIRRNPVITERELQECDFSGWINPQKYVFGWGEQEEICQCRKILVGSALIAFPIIFEEWRKRYEQWEELTEELEGSELQEEKNLEEIVSNSGDLSPSSQTRLEYLRKKNKDMRTVWKKAEKVKDFISVYHHDWGWNNIIKHDRIVMRDEIDEDGEPVALPSCVYDMGRSPDTFDLVINKTVVLMDFLDVKCGLDIDQVSAIGLEAYKTKLTMYPMLRFYINEISFTKNMHDLVLQMTKNGRKDEESPCCSRKMNNARTSALSVEPLLPLLTDFDDDPDFKWLEEEARKGNSEGETQSRQLFSKIENGEVKMSDINRLKFHIRSGACTSKDLEDEMMKKDEVMDVD